MDLEQVFMAATQSKTMNEGGHRPGYLRGDDDAVDADVAIDGHGDGAVQDAHVGHRRHVPDVAVAVEFRPGVRHPQRLVASVMPQEKLNLTLICKALTWFTLNAYLHLTFLNLNLAPFTELHRVIMFFSNSSLVFTGTVLNKAMASPW